MARSLLYSTIIALAALFALAPGFNIPAVWASDDHHEAHELRHRGDILPLDELLAQTELAGLTVIEVELERENGRLVYELELLDEAGRVHDRYYDAVTGEPLDDHWER